MPTTTRRHCLTAALAGALVLARTATAGVGGGLPELCGSSGARGSALADATVSLRDLDAASANPAALAVSGRHSVAVSHTVWVQGTRLTHAALAGRRGQTDWGVAAQFFAAGDLERRTGPTAAPLGTFGLYDAALSASLARAWRPRLRVGMTGRLLRQSIATAAAAGAAVDLGVLAAVTPALQAGVALRYLGAMTRLQRERTDLPTTLRIGLAYAGSERVRLTGELQRGRGRGTTAHAGAEYLPVRDLAVRLGYQTGASRRLSAGVGVQRTPWGLDYAYVPLAHGLGAAHQVSWQLHR